MEVVKVATAKREALKKVSTGGRADIKQAETLKTSTPSEKVKISKKAIEKESNSRVKSYNRAEVAGKNRTAGRNIEKALQAVRVEMEKVSSALRGKQADYTINSNHEVILKIRDRATGDQIKQIPSEASVAAKKAFRQVTDKLFDKTI